MAKLILVAEVQVKYTAADLSTVEESLFLSTHRYTPPPGGSPREPLVSIEPHFIPRILAGPSVNVQVGCTVWRNTSSSNVSELDIINTDHAYDYLLDYESKGKKGYFYLGYDNQDFDQFTMIATLTQDRFISTSEFIVRLGFSDDLNVLDNPIQATSFPDTTPNTTLHNTPMPKMYGKCKSMPLSVYDKANEIYQSADVAAVTNYADGVYDKGVILPLTTGYTIGTTSDTGKASITLVNNSVGKITADGRSVGLNKFDTLMTQILETDLGLTNVQASSFLDVTNKNDYNIGMWIDTVTTGREATQAVLDSFNAWMYQSPTGEIKSGVLEEAKGNPLIKVDKENGLGEFIKIADDAPGLSDNIAYRKNWYVFDINELAASVPSATKEQLTAPYRSTTSTVNTLHSNYAHAVNAEPFKSILVPDVHAQELIDKTTCYFGGRRWFYESGVLIDELLAAQIEPDAVIAVNEEDFKLTDAYDINVHPEPLATSGCFRQLSDITSAGSQDVTPTEYELLDNFSTIWLKGNVWKNLALTYNVSVDTLLEFDIKVTTGSAVAKAVAIGVNAQSSGNEDTTNTFQIAGSSANGSFNQDYKDYVNESGWRRYSIPVGKYITGPMLYIRLIGDHDTFVATNYQQSFFRNVRLREKGYLHKRLIGVNKQYRSKEVKLLMWGA